MNNFEVIIGIENHVELKTKTKMFSPGKVGYGYEPNTCVNEIDLALPGTLPSVNKKGVKLAILAANALNMEIDSLLRFDRKNYYYSDLPKGYQITQQFFPIGKNGTVKITLNDGTKKNIEIERLHIEEDTAKQNHIDNITLIDYNRAGIGLIEIVTKPVLRSAEEACLYVEKIREILLFLNVSDVKMNEGSLRTDLNISIRPYGTTTFSNKVEIKNINSISNMKKSIEFEIERQKQIMLKNEIVKQETRRFDDTTQETISMRNKSDAVDYKYVTEPNIFPIKLDDNWISEIIKNSPELADTKRKKYINEYKISQVETEFILSNYNLMLFFEETTKYTDNLIKVSKMMITEIQSHLNNENIDIFETKLTAKNLCELINFIDEGVISSKHVKIILPIIMIDDKLSVEEIIDKENLKLISDEKTINEMINEFIDKNNDIKLQYKERPEKIIKMIMGDLMKKTKGNINPVISNKLILKALNE